MSDVKPEATTAIPPRDVAVATQRSVSEAKVEAIIATLLNRPATAASLLDPQPTQVARPAVETATDATAKVDPILILLARLQTATASFPAGETGLTKGINQLSERAATTDATKDATFRTHVAYALQDTNRLLGANAIEVPAELKAEMTTLAGTSPGLTNKAMKAMLQSTQTIGDRSLIRDLRRAAASMATMQAGQASVAVSPVIAALENRVRLAPREEAASASVSSRPNQVIRGANVQQPDDVATRKEVRAEQSPGNGTTPDLRV